MFTKGLFTVPNEDTQGPKGQTSGTLRIHLEEYEKKKQELKS